LRARKVAGWIASIVLAISPLLVPLGWGASLRDYNSGIKLLQVLVVAMWTVMPPIWFWYEYFYLRPKYPSPPAGPDFDEFKYGQDLASKIWIAATSTLLILYFWKDIKP
jgi:hypothetical protein